MKMKYHEPVFALMHSNYYYRDFCTCKDTSLGKSLREGEFVRVKAEFAYRHERPDNEVDIFRLIDGSVVDVWGRTDVVNWSMPGTGAPCTSTSRPGRWRSFPYLAELEGEDAEALWGYLCKQWDSENNVEEYHGRKLLRFNFFMLQADVLPDMAFSATRKRLVRSYECVPEGKFDSGNKNEQSTDSNFEQQEPRLDLPTDDAAHRRLRGSAKTGADGQPAINTGVKEEL